MKKFELNKKIYTDQKTIVGAIVVMISRVIKIAPNFSLLGSFGFFSQNFLLFFANIILFDWLVGGFYQGFIFNYLGFASYWLLGKLARTRKQQLILLPLASFLFFLISNFGVWLFWYEHNLANLGQCYLLAVPFYKNTLLSDLIFGYSWIMGATIWQEKNKLKSLLNKKINLNF